MPSHETDEPLVVRRVIPAPPAAVFRAWSDPELAARWGWGRDHDTVAIELDCRPGGRWRHHIRNRVTGDEWHFDGVFEAVDPPRRLVHTFFWRSADGREEGPSLVEVDLIDRGGSTEVVITHTRVASKSREGTHDGWVDVLECLERSLGLGSSV